MGDVSELTAKEVAYLLGVAEPTVFLWAKDGNWLAPARVKRGKYDGKLAVKLYVENWVAPKFRKPDSDSESMDDAKRRKEIAAANIKELEEAELRGRLIDKDEAIQWVGALVDEARTAFVAMPRRMAPVIYGKEIRDSENMIRKEVTRILNKLARPLDDEKAGS